MSFLLISSLLHHRGCEESIVVPFFYSASLMLLPLILNLFLFIFSLFPILSLFTLFPISLLFLAFSPFSTNARDTERAPVMSMYTKALIHENKEWPREGGRGMDDKKKRQNKRERERERLECTLEWLWTVNPYSFLLLWLYFS